MVRFIDFCCEVIVFWSDFVVERRCFVFCGVCCGASFGTARLKVVAVA